MPNSSPNHLNSAPNTDNNQNEILSDKQHLTRLQNEIGSKVLALVNFESKHKDIVESSFNKARQNKEKLPGKNNERRNFAYLSRLNNMVEKHGDALERKLWAASAKNLVMDYEDIPDAYWKQQEQILRDNGQGRELSRREKEILAEDLIEKQRQSITSWTNYLGDKDCPYPLWFKVYAFDGISKMSNALNLDDADYNRRDNTTALSFPKLNAEILAKVYRQINDFYGVDKKNWLSKHSDDEKLVSLVKSANFPKLYAKELVDTKVILKTPERTEDVHGDWFEYKLGDEEEIASLAEGTHWCIVDPNVAHNYLTYGEYGHSRSRGANKESNSKAKFIIFRLEDPNSPGVFASNGSASIRLDPDGKVAEISGLNNGQAVEDALVPIVKEKTLSLPGGENYLQKFDDKQALIRLDKKMEKGEDLTKEELSFLYELDRPIATLDTYNEEDPRIPELKEKYGIEYALEKGVDVTKLVSSLNTDDILENLNILLRNGADVNNIISNMHPYDIADNLDCLLKYSTDINNIVSNMKYYDIVDNLDSLLEHGADIDVNELVSNLDPVDIADNLDFLLKHGADINNTVSSMDPNDIFFRLDSLLEHGADIDVNELVSNMNSGCIVNDINYLLDHGADINNIVSSMDPDDISFRLKSLLEHGADVSNIVKNLNSYYIANNLDSLLEHGADINVNELISDLRPKDIAKNLGALLKHGVDANNIVDKFETSQIINNLDSLLNHGADVNNIINKLKSYNIAENLGTLLKHGVDANNIVDKLESWQISYYLKPLLNHGADINHVVNNMNSEDITKYLKSLLEHGVDINLVVKKLNKKDIENNIELLREYGANLDTYQENN